MNRGMPDYLALTMISLLFQNCCMFVIGFALTLVIFIAVMVFVWQFRYDTEENGDTAPITKNKTTILLKDMASGLVFSFLIAAFLFVWLFWSIDNVSTGPSIPVLTKSYFLPALFYFVAGFVYSILEKIPGSIKRDEKLFSAIDSENRIAIAFWVVIICIFLMWTVEGEVEAKKYVSLLLLFPFLGFLLDFKSIMKGAPKFPFNLICPLLSDITKRALTADVLILVVMGGMMVCVKKIAQTTVLKSIIINRIIPFVVGAYFAILFIAILFLFVDMIKKKRISKHSVVYRESQRFKDLSLSRWYMSCKKLNANAFGGKIRVSPTWESFLQEDCEPENPYSKHKLAFAHTLFHEWIHCEREPAMLSIPGSYARFRNFTRECRADHYGVLKCLSVFTEVSLDTLIKAISLKVERCIADDALSYNKKRSRFDAFCDDLLRSHPSWTFRMDLMTRDCPFEDKLEDIARHAGFNHQSGLNKKRFEKMREFLIEEQKNNPSISEISLSHCNDNHRCD